MMPIALAYFALVVSLSNHEHNSAHRPAHEVANDLVLRGTVRDQSGLPVPRALVYVDGTQIGADTDSAGRFALALDPPRAGTLTVFRDGFSIVTLAFDPVDPLALESLAIVLLPAPVADSVTVTAPRAPAPPASTFRLRPLDVVRTPGSAADLMRALQTLPGIAQIDEGAGLYVRGGDTSEVLVLLDDAVVFHPYRAEQPAHGGACRRHTVDPEPAARTSCATGGCSVWGWKGRNGGIGWKEKPLEFSRPAYPARPAHPAHRACPSPTRVAEIAAAAAVTHVLQLNRDAVRIREVELRRPAGRAAAILHSQRHVRFQRSRGTGSVPSRCDAVGFERLEHLVRVEPVHVQTHVIDSGRTGRRRARSAVWCAGCAPW